jgi:hypothetical protein
MILYNLINLILLSASLHDDTGISQLVYYFNKLENIILGNLTKLRMIIVLLSNMLTMTYYMIKVG